MTDSVGSSNSIQSGPLRYQNDVNVTMKNIEDLLEENKVLDKKIDLLMKKKEGNTMKISGLVGKVKSMGGRDDYDEVMIEQEDGDKDQEEENLTSLSEEENVLIQSIQESTRNLMDHEKLLQDLKAKNGQDQNWHEQWENVLKFREVHKKYKDSKEKRLRAIRQVVLRIEHGSQPRAGSSTGICGKKKVLKEKFVINKATLSSEAGPSSSKSSASKRNLNESVVDCGLMPKKISRMEREAMVPRVIKMEEDTPPNPYGCNICHQSFTSATPLVIHLEKHYAEAPEKFDCPFPDCSFSATKEKLTTHVRAKHTKEQLFCCSSCPTKFHTMLAKKSHEKKHSQPTIWAQCGKAACLRFYKVARSSCRCVKK
eukprot:GFUD01030823.1.p1 GENE.GFUD01030823.1~~GFUD01030823.1.p1  ORF type:complete len:369 (-),score=102.35 GFUD01030823.1:51-1157(-)